MVAKIQSVSFVGLKPFLITVEVEASRGLPRFEIVGLAEGAIKESKNRVMAALKNSGLAIGPKKITVNLAPANVRKEGTGLDLPIALGVAQAMEIFPSNALENALVMGELSLDGEIKKINGALLITEFARANGFEKIILPAQNTNEAVFVEEIAVLAPDKLGDLIAHLNGDTSPIAYAMKPTKKIVETELSTDIDWSEIASQERAKRALEIAAAGHHNVLLIGPPGVGKTFIARRFPTIIPALDDTEMLERLKIYSLRGHELPFHASPLFRMPHHSASLAGMVGGGKPFRPGELSLAHKGVLFLDEMVEFRRDVLEMLRQPLESGKLEVVRSEGVFELPADFIFIGACNGCPCGALGASNRECHCTARARRSYWAKLSAPILDRFDMVVELAKPTWEELWSPAERKTSRQVRTEMDRARKIQEGRNSNFLTKWNGKLSGKALKEGVPIQPADQRLLSQAMEKWGMSVRSLDKVLKVARTVADLSGDETVSTIHLTEALQYRYTPKTL